MFGAILKTTNSSFQKGMTFCSSIYVKKVMKLLAFIFEQSSYLIDLSKQFKQNYPGIQFRLPCTPQDNFSWVPNCSLGPTGWETKVSSKKFRFGLCEIAWFLCRPIANLRRGVCL